MQPKDLAHLTKFIHGDMSPQETHRAIAWNGRGCDGCRKPAVVRALSFASFDDLNQRAPEFLMKVASQNGGQIPIVEFTYGKFVKIGESYACADCRATMEREAAHKPSWVLVELQEGPNPKAAVSVTVPEVPEKTA